MKKVEVLPLEERIAILRARVANLARNIVARQHGKRADLDEADEFSLEAAQRSLVALEKERENRASN
jgi:hypothetical protein